MAQNAQRASYGERSWEITNLPYVSASSLLSAVSIRVLDRDLHLRLRRCVKVVAGCIMPAIVSGVLR